MSALMLFLYLGEKYLTEMKTIMMVIMMQIMEIAIATGDNIIMVILDPSVSSVLPMVIVIPVGLGNVIVVLRYDPDVIGVDADLVLLSGLMGGDVGFRIHTQVEVEQSRNLRVSAV